MASAYTLRNLPDSSGGSLRRGVTLSNSPGERPAYLKDPRRQFPLVLTPIRTPRNTQRRVARTGIKITARVVRGGRQRCGVVGCGAYDAPFFVIRRGVLVATIGQIGTLTIPPPWGGPVPEWSQRSRIRTREVAPILQLVRYVFVLDVVTYQ
jgi:hypothetical protein